MKRHLAFAWFLSGSALMLIPFTVFLNTAASDSISRAVAPGLARLGDRATVHAEGRGAPRINLTDGREVLTAYAGEPDAQRLLQQNLVQPLTMASSDFDEDGVPDLVSGYAAPNGGMLTLHRGNVDAIYPNTLDAQHRKAGSTFTDAPFLSPARAFETPAPVDFLGCGDFDADGHWDVVAAARGGSILYFYLGDGRGNLSAPRQLELSGTVTALATGEINRADGLTDLVIGTAAAGGPQALVFEGPEGALRANPEAFALPAVTTAMALGRLDDDYTMDLSVAAGSDLMVVYGRDRKLSLDQSKQAEVPQAIINRRSFPFEIKSVAIGDFTGRQHNDLALLAGDGTVRVLNAKAKKQKAKSEKLELLSETLSETLMGGAWPGATELICARVSSLPADSLVVVDSADHQLHIVVGNTTISERGNGVSVSAPLDVEGEPVAVLPMRLNTDAISDLVILRRGQVAPTVTITAPLMTFTVSNTGDNGGIDPVPGAGTGTLRQAIVDANANAGADTINFSISIGPQTINLASTLPQITGPVTIDATTQPLFAGSPIIELVGTTAGSTANGLTISAGTCVVTGLVINRFGVGLTGGNGILLTNNGGNRIERNFIGTNVAGTAASANSNDGIGLVSSPNNLIINNVLSGNSDNGILLAMSSGNTVVGNLIGTNATGTAALGNITDGVEIDHGNNNIIGGTTIAERNVISGNRIGILNVGQGNVAQGNFIGTDVTGTAGLGNVFDGVAIAGASNTVGGTAPGARNIISANISRHGVQITNNGPELSTNNLVQGNFIGTDVNGTSALGNSMNGVEVNNVSTDNTVGGTTAGARNLISANGQAGVLISGNGTTGNQVSNNFIGTNQAGTAALPNAGGGVLIDNATNTTVGGTTASARNVISGNNGFGVALQGAGATANLVQGNFIGTDSSGVGALGNNGNGVVVSNGASNNSVGGAGAGAGNIIAFNNGVDGVVMSGGTGNAVLSNSIFANAGLGIDLSDDGGVTPNDVCDGDPGANNLQNFPVLASATSAGGNTTIVGTLNSTQGTTFRIEFFSSPACDPSGNGEGQTFIGFTTVATLPAVCDAPINVTLPVAVTVGNVITSTATDPSNNTSEFSQCVTVTPGAVCTITCPPTQMTSNDPNQCGAVVTYPPPTTTGSCGTVTCTPASGSFFPKGTTVVTCNTIAGPSCAFNVTVNDTQPPTITCPPNQTVAANVPTVVNYPPPTAADNCPGVSTECNPPSGSTFPVGVTTGTCTATDMSGNTASCMFTVTVANCTISCPANLLANTASNASLCGTTVVYPAPTTIGGCGPVSCNPPSGSFLPVGATTVVCTTGAGPSCSFEVTVVDSTPPRINCTTGVTATLPAGKLSAVVNYPAPIASDNCSVASVVCVPPSGSTFPAGSTLVTCTATDAFENANRCFFFVTLVDSEAPVIRCPANVRVDPPQGQTSAVVSYPPPVVTDNVPGASFVCLPPSGSTFPLCVTIVTCTATDLSGNKAACAFTVTVNRPGPQLALTLEGGKSPLDFPVTAATRKPSKGPTVRTVTIQNLGCTQVSLFLGPVVRVGPDVDSGRILATRTVDSFFRVTLVNTDGSERPVDCEIECPVRIDPNQSATLRVRFNPTIPGLAGKTSGIAASEALPNNVTSRFGVAQNLSVDLLGRVATPLQLMNANNPRKPPRIGFTRSGNEFTVSYAIYDSNLDVSRAKYEFLDSSGHVVGQAIEVDLAQPLGALNLVRGQSFGVDQRFSGANSHPEVTGVRLTVFDGETSVTDSSSASATSISAASIQLMNRTRRVTLYLPEVKLSPQLP